MSFSNFKLLEKSKSCIVFILHTKILNDKKDFVKAWQLNERHYGALTGLNKTEMGQKIGEDKVLKFRRSWDIKPEPLSKESPYHPLNIKTYDKIPKELIIIISLFSKNLSSLLRI